MQLEAGSEFRIGRQVYRCVETFPHVRRDGLPTEMAILETRCPKCGSPFRCLAHTRQPDRPAITRRCPKHHRPGSRVKEIAD
jgi:hypothetical protein